MLININGQNSQILITPLCFPYTVLFLIEINDQKPLEFQFSICLVKIERNAIGFRVTCNG